MARITRKNIAPLHDLVTVQLSKEDYHYAFEKALKKASREISLPGFREGYAPASLIRKVYGADILYHAVEDKAIDLFDDYIKKEDLELFAPALPYDSPEEEEVTVEAMGTYEFVYEIGVRPKVVPVLPDKNTIITRYKIELTEELIAQEEKDQLEARSVLEEIPAVETEEDIVFLTEPGEDFEEVHLEELEDYWEPFPVKEFSAEVQKQAMGAKAGDKFLMEPDPETNLETDGFCYVVKVGRYKTRTPGSEVYEEIFPGQSVPTAAAFTEAVRQQILKGFDQLVQDRFSRAVIASVVQLNPMELPTDFLKRSFIAEEAEKEPKERRSPEEIIESFADFKNQLHQTLAVKWVADALGVKITEAELRPALKERLEKTFERMNIPFSSKELEEITDRQIKNDHNIGMIILALYDQKVLDGLLPRITVEEKEIEKKDFYNLPEEVKGDSRQCI